jgi:O-antigen/teichoic acid export membrane protein
VEQYGIITELYAYVAVLLVILTYGMETGLFKFSAERKNVREVFNISFLSVAVSSGLFIVIVLLLNGKIAGLINYSNTPEYISLLGATVGIDALTSIIYAKLRIEEKIKKFAILKIVNVILTIFFVFLFLEGFEEIAIRFKWVYYFNHLKNIEIGYIFIANLLASIFQLVLLFDEFKRINIRFDFKLFREILKYSLPLLVVGLAGMFNETIERILLRFFLPENVNVLYEIGIYGANYRIALLMTIFIQMFRYAAEPFFFTQYSNVDAKEIFANVLKYFILFCLIIFLFVTMYIDILKYFIDKKFHSGLRIVNIILVANIFLGILFNVNMWYKLIGKTYYGIYITGLGAIISVVFNIIFIPKYSYMACAWIHLVSNFIMTAVTLYLGNKYYRINYDYKRIAEHIVIATGVFLFYNIIKTDEVGLNFILATFLLIAFLLYCNIREKLVWVFIKR